MAVTVKQYIVPEADYNWLTSTAGTIADLINTEFLSWVSAVNTSTENNFNQITVLKDTTDGDSSFVGWEILWEIGSPSAVLGTMRTTVVGYGSGMYFYAGDAAGATTALGPYQRVSSNVVFDIGDFHPVNTFSQDSFLLLVYDTEPEKEFFWMCWNLEAGNDDDCWGVWKNQFNQWVFTCQDGQAIESCYNADVTTGFSLTSSLGYVTVNADLISKLCVSGGVPSAPLGTINNFAFMYAANDHLFVSTQIVSPGSYFSPAPTGYSDVLGIGYNSCVGIL